MPPAQMKYYNRPYKDRDKGNSEYKTLKRTTNKMGEQRAQVAV